MRDIAAGIHLIQQSKSEFDTRSRYEASRELWPPPWAIFSVGFSALPILPCEISVKLISWLNLENFFDRVSQCYPANSLWSPFFSYSFPFLFFSFPFFPLQLRYFHEIAIASKRRVHYETSCGVTFQLSRVCEREYACDC